MPPEKDLPSGWKKQKLNEIVDRFQNGGTPSTQEKDYWDGDIPWTTSAPITGYYVRKGERFITTKGLTNSSTTIVPKGNVLFVSRVGLGKVAVNCIDIAINQDITGIIVDKSQVRPEYLARYLLASWNIDYIKSVARGTTIKGIIRNDLERIDILVPPIEEQDDIISILIAIDRAIDLQQQRTDALRRLKQGLMNDLLTGKRRVET